MQNVSAMSQQTYMLPFLYCQYHFCWCHGDLKSQGISRRGIDQISWNIPSLASEELIKPFVTMVFNFDAIVMTGSSCLDSTKPLTGSVMLYGVISFIEMS